MTYMTGHGPGRYLGRDAARLGERAVRSLANARGNHAETVPVAVPNLTPREWQTIRLLATGLYQKEVAAQLGCSIQTTKKVCGSIFAKLGVENVTGAVYVLWLRDVWANR